MKVLLDVDGTHEETTVTIHCKEVNDSIKEILNYLNERKIEFILGKDGERQHILKPEEIHFFHAKGDYVHALTARGDFKIKEKLYELEQLLPAHRFIRLSKSVIANLYEISHFEPSFHGTLCVNFKSGVKEYASRHYVGKIKEVLKMNRRESK
ncbi:LytTR family DNA-binding domain-containing protein [Halobacillus mangrovi]|uniref:Histidine kinase n=1 Tax=Halobacillus mangrovi TaxID=402384 RepID=A0A1W5ZWK3_9BACI|nr:LytTR family DNA-binding domain-containing protein [Halobacillus mangrovi]ARI77660.1 histidine kinase [Halobacillus mangrovi]